MQINDSIPAKVYITGAGPGDEGLLTLKAKQVLMQADVILYDNLVNRNILNYCKAGAEKIYVGKLPFNCENRQETIHEKLLEHARPGKIIVRLKGGDPFVFGRGAEEAEFLQQHNIEFEIIPGVTAGIAVPAYAGIPVTHRHTNNAALFITAHSQEGNNTISTNWNMVATFEGTLVFYMGVKNLSYIVSNLLQHGKAITTPVAIIENGTLPSQRTVMGTLKDIEARAAQQTIKTPALIVVGEVVKFNKTLQWFEQKALFGKRILLTHAAGSLQELRPQLESKGAEVLHIPFIEINNIENNTALATAIEELSQYNWIAFTSVYGVHAFFKQLKKNGKDARWLHHCQIAAVGEATAHAIIAYNITSDLLPGVYNGSTMARELIARNNNTGAGLKILHPSSNKALTGWVNELKEQGAQVTQVVSYENKPVYFYEEALQQLRQHPFDAICFASPSAVKQISKLVAEGKLEVPESVTAIAIGATTFNALKESGYTNIIQSAESSVHSLVTQIVLQFEKTVVISNK